MSDDRVKQIRALRREHLTWREIGARLGISHENARQLHGPPPSYIRITRGQTLWLPMTREERGWLTDVAASLGLWVRVGRYKGNGSISMLLTALARNTIEVTVTGTPIGPGPGTTPSRMRVDAAPWVWTRIEGQAKSLGFRIDGADRRRERLIALFLRSIAEGELTLDWRPGYGPDMSSENGNGEQA